MLSSTNTVSPVLKTDGETIQVKHRSSDSLQTGGYNICWQSQCSVGLLSYKLQTGRDALDLVSFSWGGMSLGQCNLMGMGTSFHHAIACWCDNQAQRDEEHQCPCVEDTKKERRLAFLCIKVNLSALAAVRQKSLMMHLSNHPSGWSTSEKSI